MSEFRPIHIQLGKDGNRVYGELRDGDRVRLVSVWVPHEADAAGQKRHGCDRDGERERLLAELAAELDAVERQLTDADGDAGGA